MASHNPSSRPDGLDRPRTPQEDTEPTQTNEDAKAATPAAHEDLAKTKPSRIDRFIVLGPLGQGGMSSVHRAYDPVLDRQVAIKVMLPGKHQGRVMREAQALARMSHPNVVQVYEVGETNDQLFIAMELVRGQTLYMWQQQRHGWRECVQVYLQAGRRACPRACPSRLQAYVATTLNNLDHRLDRQGKNEQAERLFRQALHIWEQALGPHHPHVASTLNNLAKLYFNRGHYAQAEPLYRRALEIWEQAFDPDHPALAHPLVGLAKNALAQHQFATARDHAERAVAIRTSNKVAPERIAEARFVLAQSLWPTPSERPRARSLAKQAREGYTQTNADAHNELAEVDQWLATHRLL